MKIKACPNCGSKNISAGTMGSGVTFGVTSWKEMCRDCGYQGQPINFDSENDYKNFLKEIKQKPQEKETKLEEKPSVEDQVDEVINATEKDKEVVNLLKEYEKEKISKPVWPKNKVWWPEISLAMIFSAISLIFLYGPIFSTMMDIGKLVVYSILLYVVLMIGSLFSIVVIEYFFISIRNTLKPS